MGHFGTGKFVMVSNAGEKTMAWVAVVSPRVGGSAAGPWAGAVREPKK